MIQPGHDVMGPLKNDFPLQIQIVSGSILPADDTIFVSVLFKATDLNIWDRRF